MIPWVERKIEGVPSKYSDDDSVSNLVVNVGPPCDWFSHPIVGDDRLCSPFDRDCFILMYKCMFDVIGLRFPLSSFEVGVINDLRIFPSQLHPLSWAHVRAFAYWCEWAGVTPTVPIFFSFFDVIRTSSNPERNQDQSEFVVVDNLSDTDDEDVSDIRSHYNMPQTKSVPKTGCKDVVGVHPSSSKHHGGGSPSNNDPNLVIPLLVFIILGDRGMADELDFIHSLAGDLYIESTLDDAQDIDQDGVSPGPNKEDRHKKRHDRDVFEESRKKDSLLVNEATTVDVVVVPPSHPLMDMGRFLASF
ncbi:hypothetical protein A2U01_0005253, partial [Trifolium medium]|nr:hypothetical protein [Trifolium medium]